jgi:hypothetical protein
VARFGRIEIPDREAKALSDDDLVRRLVAAGTSRVTAERIVAVERHSVEPTRARRHTGRR